MAEGLRRSCRSTGADPGVAEARERDLEMHIRLSDRAEGALFRGPGARRASVIVPYFDALRRLPLDRKARNAVVRLARRDPTAWFAALDYVPASARVPSGTAAR